jgi:copper(I)-binding protein
MRVRAALLALPLLLAACGGASDLTVEDPWVRSAPNGMGAAYMTITSPENDRLVAAAVDPSVAGTVEVHEVTMVDGAMRMQEVAGVPLPAGEAVALEPGGYHVMLMGMPAMLAPGTEVDVTLTFASGAEVTVTAVVREDTPEDGMEMDMDHGDMDMDDGTDGGMEG